MSTSGGLGGASAIGSAGGAGSGGSAFDCSHHVVFQPHGGAEELSVGTFCDELFVCLPDSETVTAAQAALPDLSCGTEGTPFENVPEVDCPSADLVCQWSGVQDLSEEELANLCEVTSLTAQVDWVICRVFL